MNCLSICASRRLSFSKALVLVAIHKPDAEPPAHSCCHVSAAYVTCVWAYSLPHLNWLQLAGNNRQEVAKSASPRFKVKGAVCQFPVIQDFFVALTSSPPLLDLTSIFIHLSSFLALNLSLEPFSFALRAWISQPP